MSRIGTAFVTGLCVVGSVAVARAADWLQLGQQYVDYRTKSVVVRVKPDAPTLNQLKLQVKENSLEIDDIKVYLAGGESFAVALKAYVGAGRETRAIEIPGGPKAVEKVELTYRNGSSDERLALVRLLGTS